METPQYIHNCDNCHYLGRCLCRCECGCESGKEADLYYCPQGSLPTVIARFSDYGPDYISGLYSVESSPLLKEAYNRAVKAGLIKRKEGNK